MKSHGLESRVRHGGLIPCGLVDSLYKYCTTYTDYNGAYSEFLNLFGFMCRQTKLFWKIVVQF